jgi:hypothetical protein
MEHSEQARKVVLAGNIGRVSLALPWCNKEAHLQTSLTMNDDLYAALAADRRL